MSKKTLLYIFLITIVSSTKNLPSTNDATQLQDMLDILKEGEKTIDPNPRKKDAVLVLGNTGSGKSTLVQFLTGDNTNLYAREVGEDTGEFIIVDTGHKISKSSVQSQTLFPESQVDESGVTFYDCPGFSDSRSGAHEIGTTYYTKRILDTVKGVKLVFTVSYPSVREGVDRKDFMRMLRHGITFIKNIDKFQNSIALIVTKVDNTYTNRGRTLVGDEKIIGNVKKFILEFKDEVIALPNNDKEKEAIVKFLDILLADNCAKIGLFRRPDEPGVLSKIHLLQEGKKYLKKIIEDKVKFVGISGSDFGYSLSAETQLYVNDIVKEIYVSIQTSLLSVKRDIIQHFSFLERKSDDPIQLEGLFKNLVEEKLFQDKPVTISTHLKDLISFANKYKMALTQQPFLDIVEFSRYLSFLKIVGGNQPVLELELQEISSLGAHFKVKYSSYRFLNSLYNDLSVYSIPNLDKYKALYDKVGQNDSATLANLGAGFIAQSETAKFFYQEIKDSSLEPHYLRYLKDVLQTTLFREPQITCIENSLLLVQGNILSLSDINSNPCKNGAKAVQVYALKKIFIDSDLVEVGKELQLSIIAPTWEVIGTRKILLDGLHGQPHNPPRASSGHGIDGGTGGKPGSFLGIGEIFINGKNLFISANGGNGGPGQHGSNGLNGQKGETPPVHYKQTDEWERIVGIDEDTTPNKHWEENNFRFEEVEYDHENKRFEKRAKIRFTVYGKPPSGYTNAGNGGNGGQAAQGGEVALIELQKASDIVLSAADGQNGQPGQGGNSGRAQYGDTLRIDCDWVKRLSFKGFAKKTSCNGGQYSPASEIITTLPGTNGVLNSSKIPRTVPNWASIITTMRKYLVQNFHKTGKGFWEVFNEKASGSRFSDMATLLDETKFLEKQYYQATNKSELMIFYKSLSKRVLDYSRTPRSEEALAVHKQVLKHLYVNVLTKIWSINNGKDSTLITDLISHVRALTNDIDQLRAFTKDVAESYQKKLLKGAKNIVDDLFSDRVLKELQEAALIIEIKKCLAFSAGISPPDLERMLFLEEILKIATGVSGILNSYVNVVSPAAQVKSLASYEVFKDVNSAANFHAQKLNELLQGNNEYLASVSADMQKVLKGEQDAAKLRNVKLGEILKKIEEDSLDFISKNPESVAVKAVYDRAVHYRNMTMTMNKSKLDYEGVYRHEGEFIQFLQQKKQNTKKNKLKTEEAFMDNLLSDFVKAKLPQYDFQTLTNVDDSVSRLKNLVKSEETAYGITSHFTKLVKNMDGDKTTLQNLLDDYKLETQQILNDLMAEEDEVYWRNILEEGIATARQLLDYSDDVYNAETLSTVITDIAATQDVQDDILRYLNFSILKGLAVGQLERLISALRQQVFPFAQLFKAELVVPKEIGSLDNIGTVIDKINDFIKTLETRFLRRPPTLKSFDKYVHEGEFSNSYQQTTPFFVWRSPVSQKSIQKLLGGQEVVFKADVLTNNKNAIKFNEITISLRASDDNLQNHLNKKLENFQLSLTNLGNSYYRCGKRFYRNPTPKQTQIYTLKENDEGEPTFSLVYQKINTFIQSPYALWSMKLIGTDTRDLAELKNEKISVELNGYGQYLDRDVDDQICNEALEQYYNVDTSVSEVNDLKIDDQSAF